MFLAQLAKGGVVALAIGVLRGIHAGVPTVQRNRNSSGAMQLPYEIAGFTDLGQSLILHDRDARR